MSPTSTSTTKVSAGPDAIATAYQVLESKKQIDYDGVVGPLDFDKNGESAAVFDILCVTQDGGTWNFKRTGVMLKEKDAQTGPVLTSTMYQPCK